MDVTIVFLAIIVLFVVLLLVKKITRLKLCALCIAVSLTWFSLLVLHWLGLYENTVLIALLIGQSVLGVYYLAEKHYREELMLFRVPGWLTLTYLAYFAVGGIELWPLMVLAVAWTIGGVFYAYRSSPRLKSTIDHIIACCRDW